MIGVIVALGVALALVLSARQETKYAAKGSILFQDQSQDLALTGTPAGVFRTAQQAAQIGADTLLGTRLMTIVKSKLRTARSVDDLKDLVTATADPASGRVVIEAQAGNAQFTADLADAVIDSTSRTQSTSARARYRAAARDLERRSRSIGRGPSNASKRSLYDEQIARLRTLSAVARPVTIASHAQVPTNPIAPKPARNAILGGILGVFLALIAAYARASLDRRLRSEAEMREALELPILGHIGRHAMGRAGFSHSGLGSLSPVDAEAFRILRTNVEISGTSVTPKRVLVTSPMPEEGKSTVAASLAFMWAALGRRTLLVECDLRRPSLAERLGVPAGPGLVEYLSGQEEPQSIVRGVPIDSSEMTALSTNGAGTARDQVGASLSCIVAGGGTPTVLPDELLASHRFSAFLAEVSEVYDVVVIDTPPLLPVADTLELLGHVDTILLCVRSGRTTRDQARAAKSALAPYLGQTAGVVLTGANPREGGNYGYYGEYAYTSGGKLSALR